MSDKGSKNILFVQDDNLDGKVDYFGGMSSNMEESREVSISEAHPMYPSNQRLYLRAMSLTEHVVPKKLRDAVEATPKV
jgi:hypothetical protein